MIKVLYIIYDLKFGGGSRHLYDLITSLDKKRFKTVLISPASPITDKLENKTTVYKVEMKYRLYFAAIKKIQEIMKKEKPDLIHLHSERAGILGILAKNKFHIPIIYTEHLFTKDYQPVNKLIRIYQIIALKYISAKINKVIAVSKAVKDYLISKKIFPENKIEVIYNGIELKAKGKRQKEKGRNIIVGSIGTLNELKGYRYLIEAMKIVDDSLKIKNWKLKIIGQGDQENSLKILVKKLNLEKNIEFVPTTQEINKAMADLDIYVQPSLSESFGLAIAEAMSQGLPVIATKSGGIPELVKDCGILVQAKDTKALATAIIKLAKDKKLRQKLGRNALNRINKYFNLDKMVRKTEKLYERIYTTRA